MKNKTKYILVTATVAVVVILLKMTKITDVAADKNSNGETVAEKPKNERIITVKAKEKNINKIISGINLNDKNNHGNALAIKMINIENADDEYRAYFKKTLMKLDFSDFLSFFFYVTKHYEENEDLNDSGNGDWMLFLVVLLGASDVKDNDIWLDVVANPITPLLAKYSILTKVSSSSELSPLNQVKKYFNEMENLIRNHNTFFEETGIYLVKQYYVGVIDSISSYMKVVDLDNANYESVNDFADDFINNSEFTSVDDRFNFLHSLIVKLQDLKNEHPLSVAKSTERIYKEISMEKFKEVCKRKIVYCYRGTLPRYLRNSDKY